MATWKKVVVSGSAISQLNNDSNYLKQSGTGAILSGSFSGSFQGDGSGLTNVPISGTASIAVSASYALSASYSLTATSASHAATADYALSASFASEANSALTATSASYALSASQAANANTATSASYATFAESANTANSATTAATASYVANAISASRATSAASADSATSASFASTASYVNALSQSVLISGSLSMALTGSTSFEVVGNQFGQTSLIASGPIVLTPGTGGVGMAGVNQYITAGYFVGQTAGTVLTGSFTGSFAGNGANVLGVISSSYALSASQAGNANTATSASFATYAASAGTASYATNAGNADTATTASYVLNAISASRATSAASADFATSATTAATASYVVNAISSSYALTASYALNANADLAFSGSTGVGTVDLASQVLSIIGTANEIETSAGGTTLTIGLPNDVTIGQDLIVSRNLTVLGTASFQNTTNLDVADRFILLASGSNTTGDGGLVIQQGTQGVGELFAYDAGQTRWAVTGSFDAANSSFVPEAFMAAVIEGAASDPTAVVAKLTKKGNIFVAADETIWIYS